MPGPAAFGARTRAGRDAARSRLVRGLLAILLLAAAPALAQPADTPEERRAAAIALVESFGGDRQINAMIDAMRGGLIENIARSVAGRMTPEQVAVIVDEVLMPGFRERSSEIAEHTVRIWQERLTAAEMRELAAFYATPLGRRLLVMLPEVTAESTRFGQEWGRRVAQDVFIRNRDALRARGLPL
jgi:hypothetical protein